MGEPTNADRAERAHAALMADQTLVCSGHRTQAMTEIELDPKSALTDLLSDLRHWADSRDLDFAACDRMAYQHYIVERVESKR